MGIVASAYGCWDYSIESNLETCESEATDKNIDEFRQRLGVYGCFMVTIFQVCANTEIQNFCFINLKSFKTH